MWLGSVSVEVLPSPKSQSTETTVPSESAADEVKLTVSGSTPEVTSAPAVVVGGALGVTTVMSVVSTPVAPLSSVTVRVTV